MSHQGSRSSRWAAPDSRSALGQMRSSRCCATLAWSKDWGFHSSNGGKHRERASHSFPQLPTSHPRLVSEWQALHHALERSDLPPSELIGRPGSTRNDVADGFGLVLISGSCVGTEGRMHPEETIKPENWGATRLPRDAENRLHESPLQIQRISQWLGLKKGEEGSFLETETSGLAPALDLCSLLLPPPNQQVVQD